MKQHSISFCSFISHIDYEIIILNIICIRIHYHNFIIEIKYCEYKIVFFGNISFITQVSHILTVVFQILLMNLQ